MVEKDKGAWDIANVQLDMESGKKVGKKAQSDPICSSAGCT